jgi:hypothetical protein
MSFKQFRSLSTEEKKHLIGGYTAPRPLGQHELSVWNKVIALPNIGAKLATKGAPTSVKSQLVSGVNYIFTFADGSTVTVYHQSWTNTLEVTKTTF